MYPLVKKILIADDHPLLRRGLRLLIASEFKLNDMKEVCNFKDLQKELQTGVYSHLILDLMLGNVNSAEKFLDLHQQYPGLAVLIYSMHPANVYGYHFLKAGARCYLNKQSENEEVIACLELFFTGRKCKGEILDDGANPFNELSLRELEVLPHILIGLGVKEIAALMSLKPNTVATFKARIFEKLQVKNIMELNKLANLYHYPHL